VNAQTSISVIDFIRIKDNKKAEALYFYRNNWKVYRDTALKQGYISSYKMYEVIPDSLHYYDLILVTGYADSIQFKNSEARFNKIIKGMRPDGPRLMNDLKPVDFRENISSSRVETLLAGGQ
jgi:hypothetical protein